jgi:uncharacterized membrane protein
MAVRSVGLVLSFGILLWRIARRSHGDRFIEFGSATIFVWIVMVALYGISNIPEWTKIALFVLVCLLCLISIFYLLQQTYRAIFRRKS